MAQPDKGLVASIDGSSRYKIEKSLTFCLSVEYSRSEQGLQLAISLGLRSGHNSDSQVVRYNVGHLRFTGGVQWTGKRSGTDPFTTFLRPFHDLIGDARTGRTLTETVKGSIATGSLICHRIAAYSALLAQGDYGAQRSLRMASEENTHRSPTLDAAQLTAKLRDHAVAHLSTSASEEVWLIADMSELRKPYAQAMPQLLRVQALEGAWSMAIARSMSWAFPQPPRRALSPPLSQSGA